MAKIPNSLKDRVRKRARNRCEKCTTKIVRNKAGFHNGSFHHRLPRRMSGPDTITNLVLLCLDCHREVHKQEWLAASAGWIAWGDHEMTPILRHGAGWVLLVPDGSFEHLTNQEGQRLVCYTNGLSQAS